MRLPVFALLVLFCSPPIGAQPYSDRPDPSGLAPSVSEQREAEAREARRRQREQLRSSLQSPTDPSQEAPRRQLSPQERQQLRLQLEAQHKDAQPSQKGSQRR